MYSHTVTVLSIPINRTENITSSLSKVTFSILLYIYTIIVIKIKFEIYTKVNHFKAIGIYFYFHSAFSLRRYNL